MKVFISYSTLDKAVAGDLFRQLDAHGIDAFLAHETIEIAAVSKTRIEQELSAADAMIVLLSNNCLKSKWTGHEVGYFYAKTNHSGLIIPISLDETVSYGIFEHLQSQRIPLGDKPVPMNLWLKPLVDAKPDQLVPEIIGKLEASDNARRSETYMDILSDHYKGMSSTLLGELVAAIIKNPCVHNAYGCHDTYIPKLVSVNRKRLPQTLINTLQERLDSDPTSGKKVVLETSLVKE